MSILSKSKYNSDQCRVAIVGLGTVGGGVAEVLWHHGKADYNAVQLAGILEKNQENPNLPIWAQRDQNLLYSSLEELLADPSIQVVVETIGGQTFARELITKILESGRDVVTANKDLMAVHGEELLALAEKNGRQLLFEASVTGAIPVVRLLQDYFHVDDIKKVSGIFNGTSNYILTEMEQKQISFEVALRQAQDLGFAEADPTNDIAGYDARYKLVILTYLITGVWLAPEQITLEGIEHLEPADFAYASRMDRHIKLIGFLKRVDQNLQAFVLPLMVPRGGAVADIGGSTNIVSIEGKFSEEISMVGKGAGSLPTASALVADLEKISKGVNMSFNLGGTTEKDQDLLRVAFSSIPDWPKRLSSSSSISFKDISFSAIKTRQWNQRSVNSCTKATRSGPFAAKTTSIASSPIFLRILSSPL